MELATGVHRISGVPGAAAYLLESEDELVLIDAGLPRSWRRVRAYVRALGRRPEEIRRLLITHGHPDHYGGAPEIRSHTGAAVLCHPADTRPARGGGRVVRYSWSPGIPAPVADGLLDDGQELPVLGGLRVVHTPGHTPGSTCFYLGSRGILFTGDTVLSNGRSFTRSMSFPGHSRKDYPRSLDRIGGLDFSVVCPGHGRPCTDTSPGHFRQQIVAKGWNPGLGRRMLMAIRNLANRD